jgi:hypothetical protein
MDDSHFAITSRAYDPLLGNLIIVKSKSGDPTTLWVAIDRGGLIAKSDTTAKGLHVVRTVLAVSNVVDFCLPTRTKTEWTVMQDGKEVPYMTIDETYTELSVNSVSSGTFRLPVFKEGDSIRDADTGVNYVIKSDGQMPPKGH